MNRQSLLKRPKLFQRLTGLSLEEYNSLKDKYVSVELERIRSINQDPQRKRSHGGGAKPKSLRNLDDKLIFILVYVRIYPLQIIQGLMFDLSEARANIWIHQLLPRLEKALGYAHTLPKRGRSLDEVLEEFPELRELGILGDGVERHTQRPKKKEKQKQRYSGKKKRHTRKNVVLSHPKDRTIVYLSQSHDGITHDKKILDQEFDQGPTKGAGPPGMSTSIPFGLDLGFLGFQLSNMRVILPTKKPKGKELTQQQKDQNTAFAKMRIKVEHAIGGVKINRSVADICRNTKEEFDDHLINIACGLHNLRVAFRYVPKK